MRKKFIYIILTVMLGAEFIAFYNLQQVKPAEGSILAEYEYTPHINVTGEFENMCNTTITFSFPLIIKEVFVRENMFVNKGQALFSVDKEKMINLLNGNIGDTDLSSINIDKLFSLYPSFLNNSEFIKIPDIFYSPESGIISSLDIKANSITLPDQELVSISIADNTVAKLTLSQTDYGKIEIGNKVIITPVAFEKRKYIGKIKENGAVVKKQNSIAGNKVVVDVYADITNIDSVVSDGLQINGIIYTDNSSQIKTLDFTYINQDEDGQYVYILDNGKALKEYVETGIETNAETQILTYFNPDTIFIKGDIEEGDRIILINDK